MATIIGLTEDKPVTKVWTDTYLWLIFWYDMVGAATAGLVHFLNGISDGSRHCWFCRRFISLPL